MLLSQKQCSQGQQQAENNAQPHCSTFLVGTPLLESGHQALHHSLLRKTRHLQHCACKRCNFPLCTDFLYQVSLGTHLNARI